MAWFPAEGGGEKVYIAKATSNAEVMAWDGATYGSNTVTITLPFAPKYIYTRARFQSDNVHWVNTWDSDISTSAYVQFSETTSGSIGYSSQMIAIPTIEASWINNVNGSEVKLNMYSSSTLVEALFIAIG